MISWFEKHNKISWLITILGAILMFYISSLEFGTGSGSGGSLNATLYHLTSYFFLALFLNFSLVRGKDTRFIFVAILIAITYGFTDEIHQYFVIGRSSSLLDVGLDSVGTFLASLFYLVSIQFRKKITKSL